MPLKRWWRCEQSAWTAAVHMTRPVTFITFCLATMAQSQERAPRLLVQAAHCLAVYNALPSKASTVILGYVLDSDSYAGKEVIYVVAYADAGLKSGSAYTLFLSRDRVRPVLDIQNNATFILDRNEKIGVSFRDPPLGGVWTQEHLASAILRVAKQTKFKISKEMIGGSFPQTVCKSYVDR